MKIIVALLLIMLAPSAWASAPFDPPTITTTEFLRRTQQLYDALPPGDQKSWKQYFADDALYGDEKGNNFTKAQLLATVTPMPTGYSGSIKLKNVRSVFSTNTAILSYDIDESETIFTNQLHARYHATDTWLYRNHLWQIAASQTMRYYEDPATGVIASALLDDYTGAYELAPGKTLKITHQGNQLFAIKGTATPGRTLPDLFFRKGVEGRYLFHRNASGKVDSLIAPQQRRPHLEKASLTCKSASRTAFAITASDTPAFRRLATSRATRDSRSLFRSCLNPSAIYLRITVSHRSQPSIGAISFTSSIKSTGKRRVTSVHGRFVPIRIRARIRSTSVFICRG